jgi:hypothetical protein
MLKDASAPESSAPYVLLWLLSDTVAPVVKVFEESPKYLDSLLNVLASLTTSHQNMEQSKPDLVVGIDFGMTCKSSRLYSTKEKFLTKNPGTGVAYANLSTGSETIRWVQRWPGRMQANENKVI